MQNFSSNEKIPTFTLSPIWTNNNNTHVEDVNNVFQNYFFGFTLDEDFSPTAKSFRQHTTKTKDIGLMYIFWLMILAVEDTTNGATYINVGKRAREPLYNAVLNAIAERKCGIYTKANTRLVKNYVIGCNRFSPQQQIDILDAIETLKKNDIESKTEKMTIKKKKELSKMNPIIAIGLSIDTQKRMSDLVPNFPEFYGIALNPYAEDVQTDLITIDEENNLSSREEIEMIASSSEETLIPKVEMLFTPVPHKDDPDKIVGFIAHFIVRDSAWNPGKLLNKIKNTNLIDLTFPQYQFFNSTLFPTKNFNINRYIQIVSKLTHQSVTRKSVAHRFSVGDFEDYESDMHFCNFLDRETAIKKLTDADGDFSFLTTYSDSMNAEKTSIYAFKASYRYLPDQLFWYHPHYCGLYESFFPGIPTENHMEIEGEETEESQLTLLLSNQHIVSREDVIAAMPEMAENTSNNDFVKLKCDADIIGKRLLKFKPISYQETYKELRGRFIQNPDDWMTRLNEREITKFNNVTSFIRKVKNVQSRFFNKFVDLCQLDGQVDNLNIPKPAKAMLKWYHKYSEDETNNDTITRDLHLEDPSIGFFGNSMLKTIHIMSYTFLLKQPKYSLLTEGLFSIYEVLRKIRFHLLVFGPPEAGKSFHIIDFLMKTLIPGTYTSVDHATNAADLVDEPIEMEIRLMQELNSIFYDPKAAARNQKLVDRFKAAMTSGELNSNVFEYQKNAVTGESRRTSRKIKTRQDYVIVGTGNGAPENKTALSSRSVNQTMPCSIDSYLCRDSPENKNPMLEIHAISYLRRNQFLSWIIKEMMTTGVITRDIEMQLWNDVKDRMIDNMSMWSGSEDRNRAINLMESLVRQYVVKMAAHFTWDIAGAKYFGKEFKLEHITDELQRYLYVTEDIIIFVFSLLSSEFVNENVSNVIAAIFKMINFKKEYAKKSPYELYTEHYDDKECSISFKTTPTKNMDRNKENVDLNYLDLNETLESLSKSLVYYTNPRLDEKYITAALLQMSTLSFIPKYGDDERNGYAPVGIDDLDEHKAKPFEQHTFSLKWKVKNIEAFCDYVSDQYTKEILMRFSDIHELDLSDPHAMKLAMLRFEITAIDVVLLKIEGKPDDVYTAALVRGHIQAIENMDVRRVPTQLKTTIMSSTVDFKYEPKQDVNAQFQKMSLSYTQAILIDYGIQFGYFKHHSGDVVQQKVRKMNKSEDMLRTLGTDPNMSISVLTLPGKRGRGIGIAIGARSLYDREIILTAWKEAIIMKSTKPQKFLLGWPLDKSTEIFSISDISQGFIDDFVALVDKNCVDRGGITRTEGIPFKRKTHASRSIEGFINEPNREAKKYITDPLFVSKNMSFESALRQHIAAGYPIDDDVHDLEYIKNRYTNANGVVGKENYPRNAIAREEAFKKKCEGNFSSNGSGKVFKDIIETMDNKYRY